MNASTATGILKTFFLISVPFIFHNAYAEKCSMIGCTNDIGYVYVPASQIIIKDGQDKLKVNLASYSLDKSGHLLQEYGLPEVGTIVTLQTMTVLLTAPSFSTNEDIAQEQKSAFIFDNAEKVVSLNTINENEPNSIGQMKEGARLKVLGYSGYVSGLSSPLFAQVRVVSD